MHHADVVQAALHQVCHVADQRAIASMEDFRHSAAYARCDALGMCSQRTSGSMRYTPRLGKLFLLSVPYAAATRRSTSASSGICMCPSPPFFRGVRIHARCTCKRCNPLLAAAPGSARSAGVVGTSRSVRMAQTKALASDRDAVHRRDSHSIGLDVCGAQSSMARCALDVRVRQPLRRFLYRALLSGMLKALKHA